MVKHQLCEFARPVISRLPFGRIRALALLGGRDQQDSSWQSISNPVRVFYDTNIRSYISVDLREWGGRWHYFSGQYYDQANRLLAEKMLSAGDTYIDIGANVGVQTLAAAHVVGRQGRVIAIEPNPASFCLLQAHIAVNRVTNVDIFNVALSDEPGTLALANDSNHPGTFSFRPMQGVVESIKVSVVVGDDLLTDLPRQGKILVKIDTEGYEHHVLRGFKKLMADYNAAFVVEITDEWLRQTGSSAQQLFDDMHAQGFESYKINLRHAWFRQKLCIAPEPAPSPGQHDVFFAKRAYFPVPLDRTLIH